MVTFLAASYLWLKALHVIAVIAWMAGLLYLPRLYAYHADAPAGSDLSETFKIMEARLLRIIMNPAMIAAFLFGVLMLTANPVLLTQPWMHLKLTCIVLLAGLHMFYAKSRKAFARDANTRPARFYKMWNEVPAVLMIIIVIMAVVEPL